MEDGAATVMFWWEFLAFLAARIRALYSDMEVVS